MIHKKQMPVLILCGGKGSRLGKIGEKIPKTLVEINKKPLISFILNDLINNGFKDINISGYHNFPKLNRYIKQYNSEYVECRNDGDLTILERINKYLKEKNNSILVCYGDEIANINYNKLIKSHYQNEKLVTVSTMSYKSNFGVFRKEKSNITFEEKPYLGNFNIGFMIFDKKNFFKIKNFKKLSNYFVYLCDKKLLNQFLHKGKHLTVNTLNDISNAKTTINEL